MIDNLLKSALKGLEIKLELRRVLPRGWIQASISGDDEKTALNYLDQEIGLCPIQLESLKRFSTIKGQIIALDRNEGNISVDIGIFTPTIADATISLHHLRVQLADGRNVTFSEIVRLFGFCKNLPLTTKILDVEDEKNHIEAMLAERQLAQYKSWTKSLLDRLIILGVPTRSIEPALRTAGCTRDVIDIEPLGLFEHAVVCKLGTDAAGLIPKIGRNLPHSTFSIFSPQRLVDFFEDDLTIFDK